MLCNDVCIVIEKHEQLERPLGVLLFYGLNVLRFVIFPTLAVSLNQ